MAFKDYGQLILELQASGIMPNPTYEKVLEGAGIAKENKVDLILSVNSVMDYCKAVSIVAIYQEDI